MKSSFKRTLVCAGMAMGMIQAQAVPYPLPPTSWELAGQFDSLVNPAPVWQYGRKSSVYGTWNLMATPASNASLPLNMKGWQNGINALPLVAQNLDTAPTVVLPGSYPFVVPPRGVLLHPGPPPTGSRQCELATVRFKAPAAAQYRVSGQFYGLDGNLTATQTKVYLVANNNLLHSGVINALLPAQTQSSFTSKLVMLNTNETLDFEVSCGAANNYQFGSTGLHAVIERAGEYCINPPYPIDPTC